MEGKHTRGASNSSSSMLVNSAASLLPANYELYRTLYHFFYEQRLEGVTDVNCFKRFCNSLLYVNVFVYRDPYFDTLLVLTA